jgi:DNA-binding HxlR family transcriptional regulator
MDKKPAEVREKCPVHRTLHLLGKKWTLEIMAELICMGDRRRYNDLQRALVFITPKVLSQRLKELEKAGVIKRTVYPDEIPVRVEYELTDKGRALEKVVNSIKEWGKKWTYEEGYKQYCDVCIDWRKRCANNKNVPVK